jgi:AcrR family transcriptional regulator
MARRTGSQGSSTRRRQRKRATLRAESRARLIDAALDLFGSRGYEATSTRAIASRARVNLAAIPYYFGGKEGLYRAVAAHIAAELNSRISATRDRLLAEMNAGPPSPARSRQALHALLDGLVSVIITPESARWAPFILREQLQPSAAFTVLFETFMEPTLRVMTELLAVATGAASEEADTRLRAFTLIGQVMVFRAARKGVLLRLGWQDLGPEQFDQIRHVIHDNLDRILGAETCS